MPTLISKHSKRLLASSTTTLVKGLSLVLLSLLSFSAVGIESTTAQSAFEGVMPGDDFKGKNLRQIMRTTGVPGMSIAVIENHRLSWVKGYGVRDAESGEIVTVNTRFQAASISKPVTAFALLRLAQVGKVDLDSDVNNYLASWQVPEADYHPNNPVTIRALASHTSGFWDGFGFPGYPPETPLPTLVQIMEGEAPSNVGRVTFERQPYEVMKYSGGGYTLLQMLIEDVTKQDYADFMARSVLHPLRMSNSTFEQPLPLEHIEFAAKAHDKNGERKKAPWHIYPEQAAAGLWTTPTDLARFVLAVQNALNGTVTDRLTEASAKQMVDPVGVGSFGVGLVMKQRGEGWFFEHSGGNWGYISFIIGHKRKGYGLAVMTNSDTGGTLIQEVVRRIATIYEWDSIKEPIGR